jgi:transcription-repair coupling factor (superfamily II helicase)
VIAEGKQAAFVSPTTILARQHFETVKKRMEPFGVRVGSLTRFSSAADVKATLERLERGEIDIVTGTHRALSDDVKFADLGLLILDEEQRFGVADKEKIKRLKVNVNVLSLSATPIPRTLHMSLSGIRDISVLDTPPAMRIPVQTYVTEFTESLAADALTREINRGGQAFVVYNRVETIDKFAARIGRIVPGLRIAVAHGQMPEDKLERVITDFADGGADVLVCTAIIENGIDMPRANTMIVADADRFGLSQLYQLRGRVGRSDRLAYVYFTFDGGKALTEDAYKRLDAITEYTEFGSGFKIAMRDLQIRGAGNILGREQHGHIEKVGYEMYRRLLENAVKGLDDKSAAPRETKVHTDFNAFIPDNYIRDGGWRIRIYSRISRLSSDAERQKLVRDLEDVYGKLPAPAQNLLLIAMTKNLAAKIGARAVTLKRTECSLQYEKTMDIPAAVVQSARGRLDPANAKISFGANRAELLRFLLAR